MKYKIIFRNIIEITTTVKRLLLMLSWKFPTINDIIINDNVFNPSRFGFKRSNANPMKNAIERVGFKPILMVVYMMNATRKFGMIPNKANLGAIKI